MTSDGFYDNIPKPPKREYLLQGPFWDGFRSSAKWTGPAYTLFFSVAVFTSNTIWQALWCLWMIVVSSAVIYLAWKSRFKEKI